MVSARRRGECVIKIPNRIRGNPTGGDSIVQRLAYTLKQPARRIQRSTRFDLSQHGQDFSSGQGRNRSSPKLWEGITFELGNHIVAMPLGPSHPTYFDPLPANRLEAVRQSYCSRDDFLAFCFNGIDAIPQLCLCRLSTFACLSEGDLRIDAEGKQSLPLAIVVLHPPITGTTFLNVQIEATTIEILPRWRGPHYQRGQLVQSHERPLASTLGVSYTRGQTHTPPYTPSRERRHWTP